MAGMVTPCLEARGLVKQYGRREAVRGISFSVARGEVLGLLGPNGAGKSTTISMLTGLLSPTAGDILWEGASIFGRIAEWRRSIGVVLEDPSLFEYLTVAETLRFVGGLAGIDAPETEKRTGELLSFLDLEDHADTPAVEASHGTRRKLAFALGILHAPRVLLLDEALNGVDALTVGRIKRLLKRLAAGGAAIVISSHVLDAAETLIDRCIIVDKGRAALDTTMDEVRRSGGSLEEVYTAAIGGRAEPPLSWAVP